MNTSPLTPLEDRLLAAGRAVRYPRTPDIGRAVRLRLVRPGRITLALRVAAVVLVLLAAALAVPQVRAAIIEFFQIGVIRVLPGTETPAPEGRTPLTATPRAAEPRDVQPSHLVSIAGLAGETSLEEARARVPFEIRLPSHPPDLGPPDRVFLQDDGPMLILVWTEAADPDRVRLSLHLIGPEGFFITKYHPQELQETQVDGLKALWARGPYLVSLTSGREDFRRLVDGNTLIWEQDGITYRLESDLSLSEAIRIAESLE
jgi:hypothetical protein